jgi:lysophospholipase L1-like esterase
MPLSGGLLRAALAAVVVGGLLAGGCGDGGDEAPAVAANAPKTPPEAAAKKLARLLSETKTGKQCKPVVEINKRSEYIFLCPPLKEVRQSMGRFEVVAAQPYGTGAVVDYRTKIANRGASMLLFAAPDGQWGFSRFGLEYDPSVGTSDEDSRAGFDAVVKKYLSAVRERDCKRFDRYAVTESDKPREVCGKQFPKTAAFGKALAASPRAKPRYMGGNERFGFYGLTLTEPKPSYRTISVIKLTQGAIPPYLVLDAVKGPLPKAPRRVGAAPATAPATAPAAASAASAEPEAPSSSGRGVTERPRPGARIAQADSEAIAFDEVFTGASITDDYADRGVVFTSEVATTTDNASPTSPVLAGTPKFFGDIVGHFTIPGTTTPTTVDGFSLDVGFIDDRNSVEIEYYDAGGNVVGATRAQSFGINRIDVFYRGVAGFKVSAVAYEGAGFGIDNLVVRRGARGTDPVRMISMGDSYSSGEGLLPERGLRYDCGTDLHGRYYKNTNVLFGWGWHQGTSCVLPSGSLTRPRNFYRRRVATYENLCHRHRRAYPNQIRERLGVQASDALFVACSGATTFNVGALAAGGGRHPSSPFGVHGGMTQVANAADFVRARGAADLITIGIGGNDANFGGIVAECMLKSCLDPSFAGPTISTINGSMFRSVRDTLASLRERFGSTVVAFGYPSVIDDPAQGCAGVLGIGEDERRWLKDTVLPTINDAIKDAATEAGVLYADITRATVGRGVCSPDPWINGLRLGSGRFLVVATESFHPNQKAHDAIANLFIDRYTDGAGRLLATNPAPSAPIRPPTGSEIRLGQVDAAPVENCGAACLQPAACVQACRVQIQGQGFTPGASMSVVLQSDPVKLGDVTVDPAGRVDATFKVPASVPPGLHTLTLDGMAADGTRQHAVIGVHLHDRLRSKIAVRTRALRRGTKLRRLTVKRLRKKSRVRITCGRGARGASEPLIGKRAGKRVRRRARRATGCPFDIRTFKARRSFAARSFASSFKRRLKRGTVVRVVVTRPGTGGRVLDVKIRKRRAKVVRRCTDPGSLIPVGC